PKSHLRLANNIYGEFHDNLSPAPKESLRSGVTHPCLPGECQEPPRAKAHGVASAKSHAHQRVIAKSWDRRSSTRQTKDEKAFRAVRPAHPLSPLRARLIGSIHAQA